MTVPTKEQVVETMMAEGLGLADAERVFHLAMLAQSDALAAMKNVIDTSPGHLRDLVVAMAFSALGKSCLAQASPARAQEAMRVAVMKRMDR